MKKLVILILIIFLSIISGCETSIPPIDSNQTTTPIITLTPIITTTPTPQTCNQSLWDHVYHPKRLKIIEECKTITGTVDSIKKEQDGDDHIRLKLDPKYANLTNQRNIDAQHGDLVLETICKNKITQNDALDACKDFHQDFQVHIGEHIEVTGAYVTDLEHGWNEIHPITHMYEIK